MLWFGLEFGILHQHRFGVKGVCGIVRINPNEIGIALIVTVTDAGQV
jgi:hypothetical protein